MVPRSLAFSRSEAGKPALHWEGPAATEGPGWCLQFNLSHTGSLLGWCTSWWHNLVCLSGLSRAGGCTSPSTSPKRPLHAGLSKWQQHICKLMYLRAL